MNCRWLDEHAEWVTDALMGVLPSDHEVWKHLETCDVCRKDFMEMVEVADILKQVPWKTPPRMLYLMPNKQGIRQRMILIAASLVTALALGFTTGTLYLYNRQLKAATSQWSSLEVQYQQACNEVVRNHLEAFETRFWKEHEKVIQDVIARLDSHEAEIINVRNELQGLQERHNLLVQDTRSRIQSLLRVVNSGGQ